MGIRLDYELDLNNANHANVQTDSNTYIYSFFSVLPRCSKNEVTHLINETNEW